MTMRYTRTDQNTERTDRDSRSDRHTKMIGQRYLALHAYFHLGSFPLQKSDVGLSEEQLEQLLDKLDVDGDGEINFRSFSLHIIQFSSFNHVFISSYIY